VTLTDENRRGLLGQGSVLTVTSYPNRTSVVQRGKWVLETLLGTPPPPPPPDVPELKAAPHGKLLSMREQMQAHRSNAVCAACHARMDPIGFALENYDGVGRWRRQDAGCADRRDREAAGRHGVQRPGRTQPAAADEVPRRLRAHRHRKLLTYALGRGVEYYDYPAIRAIMHEAARDDDRVSSWILAIVNSAPFQMRKGSDS
jgi:Protein of unknown function (DUF1588)./Protein of unknown function (DUF1585).